MRRSSLIWIACMSPSVALLAAIGCGAATADVEGAQAAKCWGELNAKIQGSPDCPSAVAAVDALIKSAPECAVLTKSFKLVCHGGDAGSEGGHD